VAELLPAKIDAFVEALSRNKYLLIFDDFASWLDEQFRVENPDLRRVLHGLASSEHRSKLLLITERKPFFDPLSSPLPSGLMQNEELLGLEEAEGINLLKQHLPHEDDDLLRRIAQACGVNPRMLNWFGYLVATGRQETTTLLASEGIELSRKLLSGAMEDLNEGSRDALELLSVFRRPLTRAHLDQLHLSFQKAVLPLMDRCLVTSYQPDNSVLLAEPARTAVRSRLGPERLRQLHLKAVDFYTANQSAAQSSTFRDTLPVLERAYHLAEIGRWAESTDAILGVAEALTEWGYLDLVQHEVSRVLEMIDADLLRKASCLWALAEIRDVRSEYPAALNMFEMSVKAFEACQNYEGVARCRWRLGRVRSALGDLPVALENFRVCIEICDQRQIMGPKAAALLDQGWALAQQGDRDNGLAIMQNSLELSNLTKDFRTQASARRQIGWMLWDYRRENEKSRECYDRSLEISTRHGLLKELGAVHGDLGYLFSQWGDRRAAEDSCRTAIKIREALGDQHGLASAYLNLGLVFRNAQDGTAEIRCYDQSLAIYRRLRVPSGEAEVLLRQGIAWRERARFDESEKTLKQALAIVQSCDIKLSLGEVFHQIGRTLLLVGRNEEANTWLAKAVQEADRVKSPRAIEYADFLKATSSQH
jgi:tetratricopeptide (TPR) repeat protein